jgi:DNA modification methylase
VNVLDQVLTDRYAYYHGDCVQVLRGIPDASIHLTVSSLPFAGLYIYSESLADLGNCADDTEFFRHFDYLIPELYRVTIPGRLCVMHCKDLVNYKSRDGMAGLRDFPGEIIRRFQEHGWAWHSKVTIWTDPVGEMQRTKAHGLLYKQVRADASFSRQGMPEYLLVFRRWPKDEGETALVEPVRHSETTFPLAAWQRYASPVWFDIRRTNVLNVQMARDDADSKHICPLQLDVIERCIELWSNPGDVVLDPFGGIASTGYQAILQQRRFLGIELKDSYFESGKRNLESVARRGEQPTIFDVIEQAS